MTELYVFRGTTGHAEMVTDDKSGKKLPPHSFGEWVFSRTINVATETRRPTPANGDTHPSQHLRAPGGSRRHL